MFRVLLVTALFTLAACSDSSDRPHSKPLQPLLDRYVLSSEDSIPEGVAFDPVERAFYASSVQGGSITRIAADGTESIFREAGNRGDLGGMKVDSTARRLWVCAQDVDGLDSRVWVYGLESGALELEFMLGALTTGGTCNDLVLNNEGIAYVTDPRNPYIYKLDPVTEEGEILITDPRFTDATGLGLGLNGIEFTPEGDALIVARFAPAALFRASLPGGDTVDDINLLGDALLSPDGLAFLDGDLYSVANATVSRVRFNDNYTQADVVSLEQTSGLSTATVAEGQLYVIKSEITRFVLGAPLELPFEIFNVPLEDFDQ